MFLHRAREFSMLERYHNSSNPSALTGLVLSTFCLPFNTPLHTKKRYKNRHTSPTLRTPYCWQITS